MIALGDNTRIFILHSLFDDKFVAIPAGFARLFKSRLDWAFESEPQPSAAGRRIFVPRGRMLGGSSNINAQIHQWCHPADFASWVEAGATGWGWDEVVPVFREQEQWLGDDPELRRGHEGPMIVSPNTNAHHLSRAFVEAARSGFVGGQPGYNGGHYQGAWIPELANLRGRRYSAYDAYLKPSLARPNLRVLKQTLVQRVEVEDGQVVGVAIRQGERIETISARGVVLAAGAFGSPQLLTLSGLGRPALLNELGIPVRGDLPEVGLNLQDHPMTALICRTRGTDTLRTIESLPNLLRYLLFKRGPLGSNAVEAMAFAHSKGDSQAPPDIELIFAPFEWRNQGLDLPQIDAFGVGVAVVAPRSRGSVTLRSADPAVPPVIDFNLLGDPEGADTRALLAALRLARGIVHSPPLAAYLDAEVFPGPAVTSDDDLSEALAQMLQTVYHPTSTCRMGADRDAVVDPQLRVSGIERLWVVDASVMPQVPRGHPNAVVAMIANRASGWIETALAR
ncbi:MAG: FAD-binding protein [Acidobacteria bacterium]|nr:FAD-binding protein [Acidobacteriota bacterium]